MNLQELFACFLYVLHKNRIELKIRGPRRRIFFVKTREFIGFVIIYSYIYIIMVKYM